MVNDALTFQSSAPCTPFHNTPPESVSSVGGVGPEDDVTIGIGVQPDEQCPVVELCTLGAGGKRELLHGHGRLHTDLQLRPGLTVPAGLELGDVEAGHTSSPKQFLGGGHGGLDLFLGAGEHGGSAPAGGSGLHALGVGGSGHSRSRNCRSNRSSGRGLGLATK